MKKLLILGIYLLGTHLLLAQNAPKFTLQELSGSKKTSLPKKGVVLLNMWASWCDGCKKEMPILDKVAKKYNSKKFKVIAINVDNKQKKAQKYIRKFEDKLGHDSYITFFYDTKKKVTLKYDVKVFPMSFLIKNGKILKSYFGSFNNKNHASLISDIKKAL